MRESKTLRNESEPARTMSIPEAGRRFYGLSRGGSYRIAGTNAMPVIKLGRRLRRVSVAVMERIVGGDS